jgi:1-acyl-sn-glycerol-3-phosphate acyltransferase
MDSARYSLAYRVFRSFINLLYRTLFKVEIIGSEWMPTQGPVLLASRHESLLDPLLLGAFLPRPVHFLYSADLTVYPGMKGFLNFTQGIQVTKGSADRAALRQALDLLSQSLVVGIFPEGGIGPKDELGAFTEGAAWLARSSGALILPVWLSTRTAITARGYPKLGGTIVVVLGQPYQLPRSERDLAAASAELRRRVAELKAMP